MKVVSWALAAVWAALAIHVAAGADLGLAWRWWLVLSLAVAVYRNARHALTGQVLRWRR